MSYADNVYKAEVIRWLDGDTVELRVDLGQRVQVQDRYRLARLDAPEVKKYQGVTEEEKQAGLDLKDRLIAMFPPGTSFTISTAKSGKYGRWLIEITCFIDSEVRNLNDWLLEQGLAEPWPEA